MNSILYYQTVIVIDSLLATAIIIEILTLSDDICIIVRHLLSVLFQC